MLNRFTQGRYHLLAYRLFENYMGLPYKEFINRNSSIMTKSIINEASNLTNILSSILFMMSEIFIVIFLYALMLYINYKIALVLTFFLALNAFLMMKTVSVKIKTAGAIRSEVQKIFYEIINRSFGNFKLIKLQSNDKDILKDFREASFSFAKANITNGTLTNVPRLFLEALGFSIIVFIIIYLVWKYENNISNETQKLYKNYLGFLNKLYFKEVTAQDQGIKLYNKAMEVMDIEKYMSDLDSEINELHSYVDLIEEKKSSDKLNFLTYLGGILLPPSLITGFLGMNSLVGLRKFAEIDPTTTGFWSLGVVIGSGLIVPIYLWVKPYFNKGES